MSDVGAPPAVRIRWIEADSPPEDLDLRSADEWQILLELDGTACAAVRLPNPGDGAGRAFLSATVLRAADGQRAHRAFIESFRERLGAARVREFQARTVSVVVATHRRPEFLAGALEALAELDPAPLEVVVVDNDPASGTAVRWWRRRARVTSARTAAA